MQPSDTIEWQACGFSSRPVRDHTENQCYSMNPSPPFFTSCMKMRNALLASPQSSASFAASNKETFIPATPDIKPTFILLLRIIRSNRLWFLCFPYLMISAGIPWNFPDAAIQCLHGLFVSCPEKPLLQPLFHPGSCFPCFAVQARLPEKISIPTTLNLRFFRLISAGA